MVETPVRGPSIWIVFSINTSCSSSSRCEFYNALFGGIIREVGRGPVGKNRCKVLQALWVSGNDKPDYVFGKNTWERDNFTHIAERSLSEQLSVYYHREVRGHSQNSYWTPFTSRSAYRTSSGVRPPKTSLFRIHPQLARVHQEHEPLASNLAFIPFQIESSDKQTSFSATK